jgi:hypothetical protein
MKIVILTLAPKGESLHPTLKVEVMVVDPLDDHKLKLTSFVM